MSDASDPRRAEPPLTVLPAQPIRRRRSPVGVFFRWLFRTAFLVSVAVNLFLFLMVAGLVSDSGGSLRERTYSGPIAGRDKVAVVQIDGTILEGMIGYARKQIEQAAADSRVKAVVLRINSPGGSVTASDNLYHQLIKLRDGDPVKGTTPKPLVASMGSLAASGGYYIAMPARRLVAERTTITGSIGVFAAFPNVSQLARQVGFHMDVIKAGEVKDSGSMFKEMTPQERQLWQDMVDHAYDEFLHIVEEGRPALRGKLREVVIDRMISAGPAPAGAAPDKAAKVRYIRRRADGGIFTADQAKAFGLIDQIGYLDDAVAQAKHLADLPDDCRVVTYERPSSFWSSLLGVSGLEHAGLPLDPARLSAAASPRLWYLSPQSELSAVLAEVTARSPE